MPDPSWVVISAGTAPANGYYTATGTHDGKTSYQNVFGSELFWESAFLGGAWVIWVDGTMYYSDEADLPGSIWHIAAGAAPAPAVFAYTYGDPDSPTATVRTAKTFDDADGAHHPALVVTSTIYQTGDLAADTVGAFEGQGYRAVGGDFSADTIAAFEGHGHITFNGDMACDTLADFTYLWWTQPTPSSDDTYERFRSKYQAETVRVSEARNLPWLAAPPATRITLGVFHALEADFDDVHAAGLNTVMSAAWPNILGQTVLSVLTACSAAEVYGAVILPSVPNSSLVASYDQHGALVAWYAQDEPNTDADWEDLLLTFQGYKEDWLAEKPIMVACNYASADNYRDRFRAFLGESEIVCHDAYPYRYNLWPRAYTHESPTGLMTNGPIAQDIAESQGKEHWVILQAHGQNSILTGLAMPPLAFLRAEAYLALVLGATGLIWFCMDNWYIRSANLYGIAPDPPLDYGLGGMAISTEQAHGSQRAWEAVEQIASEVATYQAVWLSATSSADYVVTFTQTTFTWSRNPIQAILKEYDGDYYLFLVNIENFAHGVTVYLPFSPTIETLFGPSATISAGVLTLTLDGWGVWGGKLSV